MKYLEMAEFACFFLIGSLAFAVLARNPHVWWLERSARKRYYKKVARAAVKEAEAILRESGKR